MNDIPRLAYPRFGEFISSSGRLPFTDVGLIEKAINTNAEYRLKDFAIEENNNLTPYGSPSGVILRERDEKPCIEGLETVAESATPFQEYFHLVEDFQKRILPEIIKDHEGEYVAIRNGDPIAYDIDEAGLAIRMYKKHPNEFILVERVTLEPQLPFDVPSILDIKD